MFAWLISHQPAVLFSQNKLATSNRPVVFFSQNKSAPAKRTSRSGTLRHLMGILSIASAVKLSNAPLFYTTIIYSLRFPIRSRLGQRHGHQSTTLTYLFYKNLYWKVIYVYSYESNFQDKSIYMIFHIFKLNYLKVIHDLYSQCLTQTLSKTTSNREPEGVSFFHVP
jgi:hypothetical protein